MFLYTECVSAYVCVCMFVFVSPVWEPASKQAGALRLSFFCLKLCTQERFLRVLLAVNKQSCLSLTCVPFNGTLLLPDIRFLWGTVCMLRLLYKPTDPCARKALSDTVAYVTVNTSFRSKPACPGNGSTIGSLNKTYCPLGWMYGNNWKWLLWPPIQ